ncbi:MAG: di-trans,poly-cis-decaprenylcistransferase [Sphingobacteriia bacterium]|jgi:tritrans,polycis-undecaprenyl-diphosphate synthase [geranylgeranyl-diphosphate specific]|nr:di-trans,poly-cis-decaprenylcistransferase [Sphingobacteriia bacterium]
MENLKLPEHVVVIPDGNRRWARERGQKPWEGHLAGADRIEELVRKALEMKIKNISFWGSSVDNLKKRPLMEKKALLDIYEKYFKRLIESEEIHQNQAKINILGRWREQFPESLKKILEDGIRRTRDYKNYNLNFLLAYGGDDEMLEAIKKISLEVGKDIKKITPELIKENLMTRSLPAVDFLIRTGGEPHLSAGFMMWDLANAQLYFSDKLFPDFDKADFEKAIGDFSERGRRLGE